MILKYIVCEIYMYIRPHDTIIVTTGYKLTLNVPHLIVSRRINLPHLTVNRRINVPHLTLSRRIYLLLASQRFFNF